MKRITISEVVGDLPSDNGPVEVCAVAEAAFDEAEFKLIVQLDSYLRTTELTRPEEHFSASWLPGKEVLRESASLHEATDLAKEIFQRWVHKVRQAMPAMAAA